MTSEAEIEEGAPKEAPLEPDVSFLAHPMFLWFWVMAGLVVLALLLKEGATQDKQGLTAVMTVGGKTTRDLTETLSSPVKVKLEDEKMIGRRMLKFFRWLPNDHPQTLRVRRIGQQLARMCKRKGIRYRFYVVPSSLPNAFALPGGYILVTTGMLQLVDPARQDSELAWVLGHELIHVERKHSIVQLRLYLARHKLRIPLLREASQIGRILVHFLKVGYSENMELEADRESLTLMRKADFYPKASLSLVNKFLKPASRTSRQERHPWVITLRIADKTLRQYWATHPHWAHRKAALSRLLKK